MNKYWYSLTLLLLLLPGVALAQYTQQNGVYIEAAHQTAANPYTVDNKIYQLGTEYLFDYYFVKKGRKYKLDFNLPRDLGGGACPAFDLLWGATRLDQPNANTVVQVGLQAYSRKSMPRSQGSNYAPYHFKTIIVYNHYWPTGAFPSQEFTAMVENAKNILLPVFTLNQSYQAPKVNPPLYIRFPYQKGQRWQITYQKQTCNYQVKGHQQVKTPLGKLRCVVVEGQAKLDRGKARSVGYFHATYGFVKMEYFTTDGQHWVFTLNEKRQATERTYKK